MGRGVVSYAFMYWAGKLGEVNVTLLCLKLTFGDRGKARKARLGFPQGQGLIRVKAVQTVLG